MSEKILISIDRNRIAEFQKSVQTTCDAANNLTELFNLFQSYEVVTTEEQFTALLADPRGYYDEVILRHVKLDTGGRKPDPEVLASLVGLHRAEYLNSVNGLPITDTECVPCKKAQIKPGRKAISKYHFDQYSQYLDFVLGTFSVNQSKIDNDLDKFSIYATTKDEIERYKLFTKLADLLNEFTKLYPISMSLRQQMAEALHLQLTKSHIGDFVLNKEFLRNEISNLKNK